jgi:peptidoglycan hydrolase-like protein with peptidoglycan-binding domain
MRAPDLRLALPAAAVAALLACAPAFAATLGERTLKKGSHGSDVITLQRVLLMKGYRLGAADGAFGSHTKRAVKRFQRRRGLTADGVVGPLTVHALSYTWPIRTASLYGPGLWGNRTACGFTLRRRTRGVANRTLPCGTPVPVYYGGRLAIFPVIDRGPYTSGVAIDLTAAAARKLGMGTTSPVRAGY